MSYCNFISTVNQLVTVTFKKSAEEERQAMTTSVFKISRGYGGCLNPPCRPHAYALRDVLTRAGSVQPMPEFFRALLTAFGFDHFEDCRTRASVPASPQKLSGSYVTPGLCLTGWILCFPLRFLIISEVPATGGQSENNQNRPQGLALLGFKGF